MEQARQAIEDVVGKYPRNCSVREKEVERLARVEVECAVQILKTDAG